MGKVFSFYLPVQDVLFYSIEAKNMEEALEKALRSVPPVQVSKTKLYKTWGNMIGRCTIKTHRTYKYYGGKGIAVCPEWLEYRRFKLWAFNNGYKEGLSLDRIKNDKGYAPGNCRWVTKQDQLKNRDFPIMCKGKRIG